MTARRTRLTLALLLAAAMAAPPAQADDYPRDPRVDVQHYRFAIELTDAEDRITGEAQITVDLLQPGVEAISIDLVQAQRGTASKGMTVHSVAIAGIDAGWEHTGDRLRIELPPEQRDRGELTLTVRYSGFPADGLVIGPTRHGERAFFGDNYPNRARHWLPTVDHVSDKATVEWVVTAPQHYQVVASGLLVEESDVSDGRRLSRWRNTVPLATKVMVIGVARFAVEHLAPVHGIPLQSWVYPQDRDAGFHDFAVARQALDYFHHAVGPYPYAKLANVQSKTRYGGMENAGNIFYNETAIRGDGSNERLIAHEVAHQWFGNSVTEADWHHVWLSEGFATYFTQLYLEHTYGRERLQEGMRASRDRVLRYHLRAPDAAIVDESFGMTGLLSTNSYQKGGWVLHMLRHEIGDEAFRAGIRSYYQRFRDGNALTSDLRAAMEVAAGRSLQWFFDQWVFRPGQPELAGSWSYTGGELMLTLRQTQAEPFRIVAPVRARFADGTTADFALDVSDGVANLTTALPAPPVAVELDPDAWLLFRNSGFGPR